jgi:hypothetical protein
MMKRSLQSCGTLIPRADLNDAVESQEDSPVSKSNIIRRGDPGFRSSEIATDRILAKDDCRNALE